jgi:hypothetical protein
MYKTVYTYRTMCQTCVTSSTITLHTAHNTYLYRVIVLVLHSNSINTYLYLLQRPYVLSVNTKNADSHILRSTHICNTYKTSEATT